MAAQKDPERQRFGELLSQALVVARLDPYAIAKECGVTVRTVARWQAGQNWPSGLQIRNIVYVLHTDGRVPREVLLELADFTGDTLATLELEHSPLAKAAIAHLTPPADAEKTVNDAVREAAEALDVAPRVLRPVAARLFQAIALGGVSAVAAARIAVGERTKERTK